MQFSKFTKFLLLVAIIFAANQLPNTLFAENDEATSEVATYAAATQEGFIGEVKLFAGNFAPRGWALCEGQIMSIGQYSALFSVLGTTYGGDGRSSFGLPDLRGRAAIGKGNGPGLSETRLGERKGRENVTLNVQNLPSHNHTVTAKLNAATTGEGASANASGNVLASASRGGGGGASIFARSPNDVTLREDAISTTVGATGQNRPLNIMQPVLGLNYIICIEGTFPSRN